MFDDYYILFLIGIPVVGTIIFISVALFFVFKPKKGEERGIKMGWLFNRKENNTSAAQSTNKTIEENRPSLREIWDNDKIKVKCSFSYNGAPFKFYKTYCIDGLYNKIDYFDSDVNKLYDIKLKTETISDYIELSYTEYGSNLKVIKIPLSLQKLPIAKELVSILKEKRENSLKHIWFDDITIVKCSFSCRGKPFCFYKDYCGGGDYHKIYYSTGYGYKLSDIKFVKGEFKSYFELKYIKNKSELLTEEIRVAYFEEELAQDLVDILVPVLKEIEEKELKEKTEREALLNQTVKIVGFDGNEFETKSYCRQFDDSSFCVYAEGGKTYHTWLDCYTKWPEEMQKDFKHWHLIEKKDAIKKGYHKCSFCDERDYDSNHMDEYIEGLLKEDEEIENEAFEDAPTVSKAEESFKSRIKVNSEDMKYIDGISVYPEDLKVSLTLYTDRLEIKPRKEGLPEANLKYSQIKNARIVKETEVKETDKSVVGRAVAGGLLLGGLGAVIGGMSGLGKKTFSVNRTFLVINYVSSSTNELQALSFEETGSIVSLEGFLRDLNKLCGEEQKISREPINL